MAKVERAITVPRGIDEVFDFVAAFEHVARWDPGTLTSEKLNDGPPRIGSTYQLVVKVGRGSTPMRYETIAFDRPLHLTFRGEGERITAEDDVHFAAVDGGTRITYRADIRLNGMLRLSEVFARRAIERMTDATMAGLERALSR